MQYKFLQRGLKKGKKKKYTAPLNAPRNDCSSKLSDRNDFPGKTQERTPGFSEIQKDFNYTRSWKKEKREGRERKRERKKESRKKEKNELKKKLILENTDVFAKLVNSGSCREAVPLISAETFHDRVRTRCCKSFEQIFQNHP